MYTYQDYEKKPTPETLLQIIDYHKNTECYKTALDADEYDAKRNVEILKLQKYLYDEMGQKFVDNVSPNNKLCSGFFPQFITQENQYWLKNGVEFSKSETKKRLGARFDSDLTRVGRYSLLHGRCFAYPTNQRLYAFPLTQFAPLYDEETGALRAGIRFWQIDKEKPLNIVFYTKDGFVKYLSKDGAIKEQNGLTAYKIKTVYSPAYGSEVVGMENYSTLPIMQLNGNAQKISELVGIKSQIDSYDRIKSGFANDFDENCLMYWIMKNGGGMSDKELKQFRKRVFFTGVAVAPDDNYVPELITKDIPYNARMAYLEKLENDLYRDFGAVNTKLLSGSNTVTAQIRAAYEPLEAKSSAYKDELYDFVCDILEFYGIDDTPQFIKSPLINEFEETQKILMIANYLDDETLLKKIPGIYPEEIPVILERRQEQMQSRYEPLE